MRRVVLLSAILANALAPVGTVRAGVYNLDPPSKYPSDYVETNTPQPAWQVMSYLGELKAVHDLAVTPQNPPKSGSLRVAYENQYAALRDKQNDSTLDCVGRVNLSACLIRLGRSSQARALLEESLRQTPNDESFRFILLLNLATVYQDDDSLLQRAVDLQREALDAWPTLVPGWNRYESDWYRRAEQYALALMEARNREQLLARGRPSNEQPTPDPLFPKDERVAAKKVQFVGDSGEYEAGGIARKQRDHLPYEAEAIVLQLLLWRPHDNRLFWLYGELLNARGQVDWAYYVLDLLRTSSQYRNRELERHWRVLREAVKPYKEWFTDSTGSGDPRRKQALLLWCLMPRGSPGMPGVGALANEVAGLAATAEESAGATAFESPASAPTQAASNALPEWRPLAVSFAAGIVVALLGLLQLQQLRRRFANKQDSHVYEPEA